jgi:8-oxo-dGTP pyrophosphatase MutT (NUDIX family)
MTDHEPAEPTIRHFTASAIVFDDQEQVLLVHHNKVGLWLYPGGHIDPNEDPAQAARREVLEETGIHTEIVGEDLFIHPAVTSHAPPFTIIEMDVVDREIGPHRHIDLVYVLRALNSDLTAQPGEVSGARWTPIAELNDFDTPAELPALIENAARWVAQRDRLDARANAASAALP